MSLIKIGNPLDSKPLKWPSFRSVHFDVVYIPLVLMFKLSKQEQQDKLINNLFQISLQF